MLHEGVGAAEARVRALRMLGEVNLPDPEAMLERYPHQLSGGQQQRIVIAMALIAEPALLIMDEPTTGLDVTVEAAVLDLVRELRRRRDSAILFISHNLGTVVRVCDRIGGHVRGASWSRGDDPPGVRRPAASLHPRAPRLPADPRPGQAGRAARAHPRPAWGRRSPVRPAAASPPAARTWTPGAARRGRSRSSRSPARPATACRCVRAAELAPWHRPAAALAAGPAAGPAEAVPILAVRGLGKTYRQSRGVFGGHVRWVRALHDVALGAGRGQTLAIVGESGCGKSTLARVLSGLQTATAGSVDPRRRRDRDRWRSRRARVRSSGSSRWSSRTPTAP